MKAVRLNELGGPEKLHVEEIPDPKPAAGEVLVKIRRAAFNRRDVFITQGLYPGIELPKTLGSDGCGTVAAHGDGAKAPAVGTRVVIDPTMNWGNDQRVWKRDGGVLGMPREGTFAEFVTVPAANVHPAPEHLSDEEAAAIPLAGVTAYRACYSRGEVSKEDAVLITGVGGGVQTFVLLYVKHCGAKAIVTSGSDAKLERAKQMGADVCINYTKSENWSKEAREAAGGGGPSLIVDSVGGDTLSKALDIARYGARVVIYGGTTGDAKIRPFSIFWKQLDVRGTSMGSPDDFAHMLRLFSKGGLRPAVDEVAPMAEVASAAARVAANQQFGKVVLAIA
ncbi:MAG: zinc-binding dehydrogenase [Candidatus Eremiobacteraeota bacterium]|nr:zinc-binding dehydrogenase [Candidatus Eremiobacteraeota bacterium]